MLRSRLRHRRGRGCLGLLHTALFRYRSGRCYGHRMQRVWVQASFVSTTRSKPQMKSDPSLLVKPASPSHTPDSDRIRLLFLSGASVTRRPTGFILYTFTYKSPSPNEWGHSKLGSTKSDDHTILGNIVAHHRSVHSNVLYLCKILRLSFI